MASEELLVQSLKAAAGSGDTHKLRDTFEALQASLAHRSILKTGLESLVICAETAIQLKNLDIAKRCLEAYFLEARRFTGSMGKVEVRDQFVVRAHYALGKLVSAMSQGLKGQPLVNGTMEAVQHVLRGLKLAASNPSRYMFLVYNGSVHHWHVSAPLQCAGLRHHLLPGLEQVWQALEKVPGHEEWKVRVLMALAMCQAEAPAPPGGVKGAAGGGAGLEEAGKTLQRAYEMAAAHGLGTLQKEAAVLQVHLACQGGDVSKAGVGGGAKGAVPAAGKAAGASPAPTRPKAGAAPGSAEEEVALRAVQAVLSAKPADKEVAEQMLRDAVNKVDPKPDGSAKGVQLMPVAQAAWAAAVLGMSKAAERWASRAAMSSELAPRVWSDMTRVLLSIKAVPSSAIVSLEESAMQVHQHAMESLDDVVTAFMKIKDVQGCHEAARLTWNAGLVLLQPAWRRHVKRAFNSAAKALEVVHSPLHRLRVALHLEAAKCDAAEDSLIKASQEVAKALALDYVVPAQEQAMFQLERPLDRYLEPLATALALRTSLTQEPEGAEEEAVALVERSKESRNPSIKKDLLGRAIEKLSSLPLLVPPGKDYAQSDRGALQVACRRRAVMWAELIRSAWGGGPAGRAKPQSAAMKLEDSVLAAAPFCLHAAWDPAVDREMVMLQAEVSFVEAEAALAALQKRGVDVVPPPASHPPVLADDSSGLRLPCTNVEQLQDLVLQAITRGMQWGLDIKEPWLVVNGAVLAWNSYLPIMHQHRYVELQRLLEPVVHMLLQLDSADSDGGLVCGLAEANAKALEHRLLLTMLVPQDEAAGDEGAEPVFRYRRTPGYELLPAARVKAGGLNPLMVPAAAAILAKDFPKAIATCEAALSKAGNAQSQALFESYARLQQLRGLVVSIPAGTSSTSEQTSRVVGIIEAVLRGSGGEAELRDAMKILQGLGQVNVELWAKLARAAAGAKVWPVALECAKLAAAVMPTGFEPTAVETPNEVPELDLNGWFWLSVSETVRGQATMALVRPGAQDMMTSLNLRRMALESYVVAARFAGFVRKSDLVEHIARLAWAAALPFMRKPLLRVALVRPLGAITTVINQLGISDRQFQLFLNVVLLESMASARMWGEALTAADDALRSIPTRSMHRPILTWKAYCLGMSGRNVLTEMTRVKEYIPEFQGHAWAVLSHHSTAQYDQLVALQKAQTAVTNQPWNKADYLMEHAEWLITSGQNDGETAEDVLLSAADALLEYDVGDDDGNEEDGEESGKKKSGDERKKKRKRLGKSLGEASLDPHSTPARLTAPLLDRMMRIWVMLSQVANMADEHTDYMLTAHHYAVRMLISAIIWAYKVPKPPPGTQTPAPAAAPGAADGENKPPEKGYPPLPDTLAGWADYPFTEEVFAKLAADTSVHAMMPATLPEAEATLAYLDLLIRDLKRRGFDMHVLPLFQLQRLVSKLAMRNEAAYQVSTLRLCATLDEIGLSAIAGRLEVALGPYWQISAAEEEESRQQVELQKVVASATHKFATGHGGGATSRAMSTGRSSLITASSIGGRRRRLTARDDLSTQNSITTPVSAFFARNTASGSADRFLPTWLQDAAADMAAGGATTSGGSTSFGACNGVGGGSGTACAQPIDMSSGGLLNHVRSLLLLRPLALHDVWLRKAEHLMKRGHYTAARDLLRRARSHAAACDHPEAEARALLMEARNEAGVCNYTGAIQLIQQAQGIGGDYDFWREAVSTYVECRLAAPHTTTTDAREALQGGIVMFTTIARDDRAAEKDAMLAAAALKLQLSELLLQDMITMRKGGVFNWKKHYEHAVVLCGQVMAALAAREAGIPHIQALLHQSLLQMEDPKPDHDMRPRYKKIEKVLAAAEEMANKFVAGSCPRDLDPAISMPVARLLARVRLALAELQLMAARARDAHAADDRQKKRPKYPLMAKGKREAEAVVVEFIDAMEQPEASTSLSPEDTALTLANSAAQLSNAEALRAKALLLAGQCMQYKFLAITPPRLQPWPPRDSGRPERRTVIGMGDLTLPPPSRESVGGGGSLSRSPLMAIPGTDSWPGSPTRGTGNVAGDGTPLLGLGSPTLAPSDAAQVNAADPEVLKQAETYRGQALTTLQEALTLALGQGQWQDAETCAMEIARCYGKRNAPARTAATQFLCLAQACKAVCAARELLLMAQPPRSAEALLLRQAQSMLEELPQPQASIHFQRVTASLAALGTPSRLHAGLGPSTVTDITANLHDAAMQLPDDMRAISLYVSPDRSTLYIAALNIPDTTPEAQPPTPPLPTAEADVGKGAAGKAADKGRPPAPSNTPGGSASTAAQPRMVLLDAVRLEQEMLDNLRNDMRSFRRNAEKVIRETISAAVDAGWGQDDTQARSKARTKGGKAGKRRPGVPPTPTAAAVFPPEVNEQWAQLLWRLELLLSPVAQLLRDALGVAESSGTGAGTPLSSAPKPPTAAKQEDVVKHKIVLLLDPELSTLPWEALPLLRSHSACITRHTSLYALRAGMQAVIEAGGGLDLNRTSYMVDTRYEGSAPEHARGPCWVPLIPWFKSTVLSGLPYAKEWKGLLGAPGGIPPDADALSLLESASSLIWLGLGRFLSCVPPTVVSSLDLRGCDVAILLGRVNNEVAHQRQVYIDNRKSAAERALEAPTRTAELLMARGVKTVVLCSMATTAANNTSLLQSILSSLAAGLTVTEAVWKATAALECELEYQRSTVLVLGAPNLTANANVAKSAGKGQAGAKKK